jgi:hypothetical protein
MAKAKKMVIPPKPVVNEYLVTLEMTLEEARTLRGITERIGGPAGGGTLRGNMDTIGRALHDAGVDSNFGSDDTEKANRAIYFIEKKAKR